MLSVIWSTFNLFIIAIAFINFFRSSKNKECVSFSKKVGNSCYSCSDDIEDPDMLDNYKRVINDKEDFRLCKACERDEKLDYFIHGKKTDEKINNFKKFLLSNKFKKINIFLLILIPVTLLIHYFILYVYDINWFYVINYSIVTFYWILFLYKTSLEYRKK